MPPALKTIQSLFSSPSMAPLIRALIKTHHHIIKKKNMKFNLAYLVILASAALVEGKCMQKVKVYEPGKRIIEITVNQCGNAGRKMRTARF